MIREGRCQASTDMRQTAVPQLTLAYLATQLRGAGAEVRLCDAIASGVSEEALLAELRDWRPRVLFANTTTPTIDNDLRVLAAVKRELPETFTVVFGAHATALHESLAAAAGVDAVIRGEPELTAREAARRLMVGDSLDGVAGLTHRRPRGVVVEPEREPAADLDALGWPARELLPNASYLHPLYRRRYTTICISRGCPFKCVFCVAPLYYGSVIRRRSVENVLDELETDIVGRHGIDLVWFYADDLTADREYLRAICRGIVRRGLKIRWWGNTRADVRDQILFDDMARAGCVMLSIGGESGDEGLLVRARKGLDTDDVPRVVSMLRRSGIISLVYFIVGLPGETLDTIRRTVAFAQRADPDFAEFYPAIPYPGTELDAVAKTLGFVADLDYSRYESGGTRSVVSVGGLTPAQLDSEIRRAYRRFYVRPRFVLNALRRLKSLKDCWSLVEFGAAYLGRFRPQSAAGAPT